MTGISQPAPPLPNGFLSEIWNSNLSLYLARYRGPGSVRSTVAYRGS